MFFGNIESWEGSTSPALPFGRVENPKLSNSKSANLLCAPKKCSWKCSALRFKRSAPRAKSTPPNFLPFEVTSNSSTPSLWILRSVLKGCHRASNSLLELKQSFIFTQESATNAVSVWLCGSLARRSAAETARCTSVTPLLSFDLRARLRSQAS